MNARTATDSPAVPLWLGCLAALAMMVHMYLVFMWVSTESTMGIIQRIFYFHVPAAMTAFVSCFVGGISSILYLVKRDNKWDDLSVAANVTVVVFEAINICMGSMWGRRVWGIWVLSTTMWWGDLAAPTIAPAAAPAPLGSPRVRGPSEP